MRPVSLWTTYLYLTLLLMFQQERAVAILTPVNGEALQGLVAIEGNASGEGFRLYEVEFSTEGDASNTWFLIARSEQPVSEGLLAEWDTSNLTDGQYELRLHVLYEGGEELETKITGLRVRNFTPIETNTPVPTQAAQPGQLPTPTSSPFPPTVTPFAPNPATLPPQSVSQSVYLGAGIAVSALILLIIYTFRNRRLR